MSSLFLPLSDPSLFRQNCIAPNQPLSECILVGSTYFGIDARERGLLRIGGAIMTDRSVVVVVVVDLSDLFFAFCVVF